MRRHYIGIAIGVFCGLSLFAQNNSLVIFSTSGEPFLLSVDREPVNRSAQSNVKTFALPAGKHTIDIQLTNGNRRLIDSVFFADAAKYNGKEFTYALISSGKALSLQFKAISDPSGPAEPPVPEAPKETAPVVDNSIYGNLYKAVNNKPVFFTNYDAASNTCTVALSDKDISYAVKLLKTINDEERQMNYVKTIVANNCYTCSQLTQLLFTFPSEMDRLEIAKPAYLHLSDRQNVLQLYPAFKYQSLKDNYSAFTADEENRLKQRRLQCTEPTDDARFNQLYTAFKSGRYENERLVLAKKSLSSICLSTAQVRQLTELFTHDREKLECLKYAYPVIVDKDKAADLSGQLQFSENKQDFLNFIANQKP